MFLRNYKYLKKIMVDFGIDPDLPYMEKRKAKLLNVIIFAMLFFFAFFAVLNVFRGRPELITGDVSSILLVCIPAMILQYKKKYVAARLLVVSSFFIFITFFSITEYYYERQPEHLLLGACIMAIFLFEGWKKNLLFIMFVIAFFIIKVVNLIQFEQPIKIDTYYIIYGITFLTVYIVASYFKHDMMQFNKKLEETNMAKDRLFRIIAHDLKNPFNSLLGVSDLQLKYVVKNDKV